MKLHRLDVEGFGPFRARQTVDFDAFADDGIFLIGGRTGAGKSSILDAICFGLYGGVPRYDGGDKRLRSDHSEPDEPTEVVVDFSTVAGRFRVTRSPAYERPAKRGGGMTTQAAAAVLEERVDGEWVGRAARTVDVATELADILQLTQEQFLQVILLAQNRFADFLLSDSRERQRLLRRLFGTERFEDYQARFDERRKAAEQALGGRRASVDARIEQAELIADESDLWGVAAAEAEAEEAEEEARAEAADGEPRPGRAPADAGTEERLGALRRALARGEYRAEVLATARDDAERRSSVAEAALTALREQRHSQVERDRARGALAELDAQAESIAETKSTRDRARSAELLRAVLLGVTRAETAVRSAAERETGARGAWEERGALLPAATPDEAAVPRRLRAWAAERTRESGAWERAAALEEESTPRAAELERAAQAVADADLVRQETERENAALPELIADLTTRRDEARREGDRADDLGRALAEAQTRRDAAEERERLDGERRAAGRALVTATEAHAQAQSVLARLRTRRLDGYAGELASALSPGEPCAVCGSTVHPDLAEHADPVSEDDVSAAEADRDAAAEAERIAAEAEASVRTALAVATERAGGRDVAQADTELAAARDAHADALSAAERARSLTGELQAATERGAQGGRHHAEAVDALAAAQRVLALAQQRAADAERQIAEARGDFDTVAGRIADAGAQASAATTLADALDEVASRSQTLSEAIAERDAALASSPFADADEAWAALLPEDALAELEERLTSYAVAREKERAILLDLELRTLPEETIDLEPHERSAADARAAWTRGVDDANRVHGVASRLRGLIEAAEADHRASAADQAEFEVLRGLADTLAGRGANTHRMNLETFVLAAELEEIVRAANLRLGDRSDGRYQLRHSDAIAARGASSGLGIVVFDAFTGQTRPARSLSGGETFLGSLALALGLAEVVTARAGGIRLDTLFIDEGFGSLDADTLEVAMRTLDELREGGRTVGVISHVEAMQEQIPAQLAVRALPDGPSVIDAPRTAG